MEIARASLLTRFLKTHILTTTDLSLEDIEFLTKCPECFEILRHEQPAFLAMGHWYLCSDFASSVFEFWEKCNEAIMVHWLFHLEMEEEKAISSERQQSSQGKMDDKNECKRPARTAASYKIRHCVPNEDLVKMTKELKVFATRKENTALLEGKTYVPWKYVLHLWEQLTSPNPESVFLFDEYSLEELNDVAHYNRAYFPLLVSDVPFTQWESTLPDEEESKNYLIVLSPALKDVVKGSAPEDHFNLHSFSCVFNLALKKAWAVTTTNGPPTEEKRRNEERKQDVLLLPQEHEIRFDTTETNLDFFAMQGGNLALHSGNFLELYIASHLSIVFVYGGLTSFTHVYPIRKQWLRNLADLWMNRLSKSFSRVHIDKSLSEVEKYKYETAFANLEKIVQEYDAKTGTTASSPSLSSSATSTPASGQSDPPTSWRGLVEFVLKNKIDVIAQVEYSSARDLQFLRLLLKTPKDTTLMVFENEWLELLTEMSLDLSSIIVDFYEDVKKIEKGVKPTMNDVNRSTLFYLVKEAYMNYKEFSRFPMEYANAALSLVDFVLDEVANPKQLKTEKNFLLTAHRSSEELQTFKAAVEVKLLRNRPNFAKTLRFQTETLLSQMTENLSFDENFNSSGSLAWFAAFEFMCDTVKRLSAWAKRNQPGSESKTQQEKEEDKQTLWFFEGLMVALFYFIPFRFRQKLLDVIVQHKSDFLQNYNLPLEMKWTHCAIEKDIFEKDEKMIDQLLAKDTTKPENKNLKVDVSLVSLEWIKAMSSWKTELWIKPERKNAFFKLEDLLQQMDLMNVHHFALYRQSPQSAQYGGPEWFIALGEEHRPVDLQDDPRNSFSEFFIRLITEALEGVLVDILGEMDPWYQRKISGGPLLRMLSSSFFVPCYKMGAKGGTAYDDALCPYSNLRVHMTDIRRAVPLDFFLFGEESNLRGELRQKTDLLEIFLPLTYKELLKTNAKFQERFETHLTQSFEIFKQKQNQDPLHFLAKECLPTVRAQRCFSLRNAPILDAYALTRVFRKKWNLARENKRFQKYKQREKSEICVIVAGAFHTRVEAYFLEALGYTNVFEFDKRHRLDQSAPCRIPENTFKDFVEYVKAHKVQDVCE